MPQTGLEPVRLATTDFKSVVSTISPPRLMQDYTVSKYGIMYAQRDENLKVRPSCLENFKSSEVKSPFTEGLFLFYNWVTFNYFSVR